MKEITDEYMKQMISHSKNYSFVVLKTGSKRFNEGMDKVVWNTAEEIFH
jgi:hypothetical protein